MAGPIVPGTGGSTTAPAEQVLTIRGTIDDIGNNALLTGSDAFDSSVLDVAWTVTNATNTAIDPMVPAAPQYSATQRQGITGEQIGGLYCTGGASLDSGTAAWFGRSLGALAAGESLTIAVDLPGNFSQGFGFVGVGTTDDPSGVFHGALIFPQNSVALYGIATAGVFVNGAGSTGAVGTGGGLAVLWFRHTSTTIYVAIMTSTGEWAPAFSYADSGLGTHIALAAGSNSGIALMRYRWVRHTTTAADGSWPWERSS